MLTEHTYALSKSSKKHICPSCEKKTFTRYLHVETGQEAGDDLGLCDRENNCSYHLHPKDSGKPIAIDTSKPKKQLPPALVVRPETGYIDKIRGRCSSAFHEFCRQLGIDNEHLQKWAIGTVYDKTAFVQILADGTPVNVKFVVYKADGYRDKGEGKFPPFHLGKGYLKKHGFALSKEQEENWKEYYEFQRCFYGAHLWQAELDTCLVESEKSAVLGAWFFPAYNWLATGGASGMKYEAFSLFNGYKGQIHNLVDNDRAGYEKSKTVEWLRKLREMRDNPMDIRSLNLFKNRPKGWDIADAIIKDDYRDPEQFSRDLRDELDIDIKVEFDEKTGDVLYTSSNEKPHYTEKELKRAKQVVQRICEAKKNIIPDFDSYRKVARACASFGEAQGSSLWIKVAYFYPEYDEAKARDDFNAHLPMAALATSKELFDLAEAAGIEVRYIRKERGEAAEGVDGETDPDEWFFSTPDNVEATDEMRQHIFKYRFMEWKNRYYFAKFDIKKKMVDFSQESNFVIQPLFLIKSKTDPKRLYEIINVFGNKIILDVPAKAMVSMAEFQVFVESQGNFLFQGNKTHFTLVKSKLYDNTQDAEEIKTLGWHRDGFYAFANGIFSEKFNEINEHGIVKQLLETGENEAVEKHYFLPAMSSIYKNEDDLFENEKKFVYTQRDIKFREWARLFIDCYGDNGIFGLTFYISSLFRDLIYSRYKFFPHLFLFGPPGTGKSTMAWSIQYMFGLERRPFMLNAGTAVGFHRTFSQFKNAVVWFDEYNNSIDPKRIQDMKGAYDGAGHVKGEWSSAGGSSNRTTSTPVHSTCVISGQELPTADNALFKRVILLQHYQTQFSDEESAQLEKLKEMQENGMSHITGNMMRFRKKMEEEYYDTFVKVQAELKESLAKDTSIEDRIIQNACMVATTYKILEDDLPWPFDWEELKKAFTSNIISQNNLISNAKETNQFWDMIDFLISEGDLKPGQDFKVEYKQTIKVMIDRESIEKNLMEFQPIFYFRLQTAYPMFMKAVRNMGEKKGMDKGSLKHYLKHSKGYIGEIKSTNFKDHQSGRHFQTNAYAFQLNTLDEQGYNFNRYQEHAPAGGESMEEEETAHEKAVKAGKANKTRPVSENPEADQMQAWQAGTKGGAPY